MAKKNWWIKLLKNIVTCESNAKTEKGKSKRWRWIFGRFRFKQLPTSTPQKSFSEAKEEQRKHAVNVAKATAVAAEAAVAAAHAAAEVVRLTTVSKSSLRDLDKQIQTLATIKIQTAFRAYIARKALRALKGVVKLQALVRGQAVRRRISTSLTKPLPYNYPSKVVQTINIPSAIGERSHSPRMSRKTVERSKLECKSQRQLAGNLFSREEIESIYLKKQEAMIRRERMKQYSFSHRERQYETQLLEETLPLRNSERHTCTRKQWAEENIYNNGYLENSSTLVSLPPCTTRNSDFIRNLRIKPRNLSKHDYGDQEVNSPYSHPRRSFSHLRQRVREDDDERDNCLSPSFPTYMASTESAKAKMRSMSTPRQRMGYLDAYIEQGSPRKNNKLYSWSSFTGDSLTSSSTFGKTNSSQSKSVSMDGLRHAA